MCKESFSRSILLLSLLCAAVNAVAGETETTSLFGLPASVVKAKLPENPGGIIDCVTEELWELKRMSEEQNKARVSGNQTLEGTLAACRMETLCDDPNARNKASTTMKEFNVTLHTFVRVAGEYIDGVTPEVLRKSTQELQKFFSQYEISINADEPKFHVTPDYRLPAYSASNMDWYYALQTMKSTYSTDPSSTINVFISSQAAGDVGTLLGIATFPWDRAALQQLGGLWVNTAAVNQQAQNGNVATLPHELGHNLGLWHTFHGVSEMSGCSDPCYENVHSSTDAAANKVGDFCADTLATPKNYACANPSTQSDCKGNRFTDTNFNNLMGYSRQPADCRNRITQDQMLRAHCYACQSLSSQLINPSC